MPMTHHAARVHRHRPDNACFFAESMAPYKKDLTSIFFYKKAISLSKAPLCNQSLPVRFCLLFTLRQPVLQSPNLPCGRAFRIGGYAWWRRANRLYLLLRKFNCFIPVIPSKDGIHNEFDWMPDRARHDFLIFTCRSHDAGS